MAEARTTEPKTLFGHPAGLYTLFFAEMWERFSYYGMRALLLFYMLKGFLKYNDARGYAVYGAYTALVYMTPFFGGMLADRLLGARRAVVLGGLLMAAGHLVMAVQTDVAFYSALALLIAGNGFFKPNISTIVGSLYPPGSPRRDGGFTLFYMGINLGAAMSPLLCGYIGETYGWHWGFGLASAGMVTGLAVFVAPARVTQIIIGLGALSAFTALVILRPDNAYSFAANLFVGAALLVAAGVACVALERGGLPAEAGAPADPSRLRARPAGLPLSAEWVVYLGTVLMVPVFALFVSSFSPLNGGAPVVLLSEHTISSLKQSSGAAGRIFATVAEEVSKPAGLMLFVTGFVALAYLTRELFRLGKVARERLLVVLILTFFSMLFWSFFEQAGSSVNNFTDRNVDRVGEARVITQAEVGKTLELSPTQEQVGHKNGERVFALGDLDALRAQHAGNPDFKIPWRVAPDNVGMGVGARSDEVPASVFQAVNPVFILIFGVVFTALWTLLGKLGREPSTPFKFALGLMQLGLGFALYWYGAVTASERGMVGVLWLVLGYLLQTTGELCLSPVGLSMITRLSPLHLVSTMMGTWFLATAFSQYLAAIISQFTGVEESGGGGGVPVPSETLMVYGNVFAKIALAALISSAICFALVPLLKRWTHPEAPAEGEEHGPPDNEAAKQT
jgi:proton-dependent oligopeptide transporter, POT family